MSSALFASLFISTGWAQLTTFRTADHCADERQAAQKYVDDNLPQFQSELDRMPGEKQKATAANRCCSGEDISCDTGRAILPPTAKDGGMLQGKQKLAQDYVDGSNALRSASFSCGRSVTNNNMASIMDPSESKNWSDEARQNGLPAKYKAFQEANRKNLQKLNDCLQNKADDLESQARGELQSAGDIASTADGAGSVTCTEATRQSPKVCFTSATGQTAQLLKPGQENAVAKDYGATQTYINDSANVDTCTQNVLGDQTTVVGAGHCFVDMGGDGDGPGKKDATIVDKNGVSHDVELDCPAGSLTNDQDVEVCKISGGQKVDAGPLYLATVDNSVTGDSCVPTGYILRCNSAYYTSHGFQTDTFSYPARDPAVQSTGNAVVGQIGGSPNNMVFSNTYAEHGTSGSGIFTNIQGYRAILAPTADGYEGNPIATVGFIPYYQTVQNLEVQSVDPQDLQNGALLMQNMRASVDDDH